MEGIIKGTRFKLLNTNTKKDEFLMFRGQIPPQYVGHQVQLKEWSEGYLWWKKTIQELEVGELEVYDGFPLYTSVKPKHEDLTVPLYIRAV